MKVALSTRRVAPLMLALVLALAPALAGARPGNGLSFGSRGSHTWSSAPRTSTAPGGAAPFQNSMTPNGSSYGSSYGSQPYGGYSGMRSRSAFSSGLMGGLIGAGLGGMLFGRGFFGGMSGGGSLIGLLLQLFILYMIGRWLYRRFAAGPALAGGGLFGRTMGPGRPNAASQRPAMFGGAGPSRPAPALAADDYKSFDQLLHTIQAAWTAHDLAALRTMATPEMVSTFAEQLAEQTSRGVRNQVTGVQLLQGDLSEAWSEGGRQYATVAMRFSMVDVTRDGGGRVVDGSLTERVTVTEIWTFLRAPGGRWVLSAIQQAR